MGFWDLEDGVTIDYSSDGTYEIPGAEVLPEGDYVALIKDIKIDSWEDNPEYIQISWSIVKPEKYKKRIVFHKLHVNDEKLAKREKALRMLYAININSGENLPRTEDAPSEVDLKKAFKSRQMTIRLKIWENDEKTKKGNWVDKVSPKVDSVPEPSEVSTVVDEDVPF